MIELTLPYPPLELNPNRKMHWAKKAKYAKEYRTLCFLLAKESGISVNFEGKILLRLDFYPPDNRHRDDDNIIRAFKSGRDGLADAMGVNDRRFRTAPIVMDPVKGGKVVVKIEQITLD